MHQSTLSHLIALGEGFTTEFKRSMPSDLGREICAFANATGGVILIGVDDAGNVIGVGDQNRLKSQVQSVARSADPPVAVEVESQCGVLCVTVPGAARQALFLRGKILHSGRSHLPADVPGRDSRILLQGRPYTAGRDSLQRLRPVGRDYVCALVQVCRACRDRL